jgi:hypothetical protein
LVLILHVYILVHSNSGSLICLQPFLLFFPLVWNVLVLTILKHI